MMTYELLSLTEWLCYNILRNHAYVFMAYLYCRTDSESDLDSNPNGYIALCTSFHTTQSQIQIPIPTANYRNGIGIRVHTRVRLPQCK